MKSTKVLGPGQRFAIWLQGCKRNCKGCYAQDALKAGGDIVKVDDIFNIILKEKNITGLTISGGEPFDQSSDLAYLIKQIKLYTKLDIIVFTGYNYEELVDQKNESINQILTDIDLLIDGRFDENKNNGEYLRGSSNQNFIYLSDKFRNFQGVFETLKQRPIEIEIGNNSKLYLIGIPNK